MPVFARIEQANADFSASGRHATLPLEPRRELAVITCMDCRIDTFVTLGLDQGDAHILRNAGARVTDDVLRSLAVSTHMLGTRKILVLGHTRCGMLDEHGTLADRLTQRMGHAPGMSEWGTFRDARQAIVDDCARLVHWADRPDDLEVAGYLLDIDDGHLIQVVAPVRAQAVTS